MYKIYSLNDPDTDIIRYIGVTSRTLNERYSQHLYDSKNNTGTHKQHWFKSILLKGKKPVIKLIEEVEDNWEEREIYWISYYNNLTNGNSGGRGMILNRSKSSKQRTSEAKELPILKLDIKGKVLERFESIRKAAKALNISRTSIGNVLSKRAVTASTYHWVYESIYKVGYKPIIKSPNQAGKPQFIKRKVEATLEDLSIIKFDTVQECADYFNVNNSYISMILKGIRSIKNIEIRYSLI